MKAMKAFVDAIKRSPKLATLTGALVAAVIVPASLMAWGPDRPLYTWNNPADHVTFNSITDNPFYGDERNFVRVKEATASNSTYSDNTTVEPGKEYTVFVYYHNNAKTSLNASGVGVAQNTKLRMEMPDVLKAGVAQDVNGYISADNATPGTVWDDSTLTSTKDVALRYVPGSATVSSLGAVNGAKLPDSLITTGTPLGYDSLNGNLPGCNEYAGYVVFNIKADYASFDVQKTVSRAGEKNYSETANVKAGEKVDFKIAYTNNGSMQQNNVVIKDTLPAGMTYVPGSTYLSNSTTNSQWVQTNSDEVTKGGINIGNYAPNGGNAFVKFTATVDGDGTCGTKTLINKASANTDNGARTDTANVVVTKDCAPGDISVCELATGKVVTIKESDFDSNKYSKDLAACNVTPTPETPVTELPQTGVDTGILAFIGLGALTAGIVYAIRSDRIRNLLRR